MGVGIIFTTRDWLALVGMAVLCTALALWLYRIFKRAHEHDRQRARQFAKYIAGEEWRVKNGMIDFTELGNRFVVLEIQSLDYARKHTLVFRPLHPDIEKLAELQQYDFVSFSSLDKCMECALDGEVNGYLRIKV